MTTRRLAAILAADVVGYRLPAELLERPMRRVAATSARQQLLFIGSQSHNGEPPLLRRAHALVTSLHESLLRGR
jgi:hypothetical protein